MRPRSLFLGLVVCGALAAAIATSAASSSARAQASAPASGQKVVDHDFIGADRCRACHVEEYAALERGPHARAYEALSTKDRTDPRCLSCHTMVPDDLSPALLGVQCESCHGAGRHYAIDYVMRDKELAGLLSLSAVDGATCARCHTDTTPALVPFVFQDKLALIKHWAERAAPAPASEAPPSKKPNR